MKEGTLASYITGFILSVALTLGAFFIVLRPGFFNLSHDGILAAILALAFVQLVIQLWFFLHIGAETGPRWKLLAFVSTIILVLIVVIASIWIMNHLNYNMTPTQIDEYLQQQQGGF